jgi:hypothetical protein
MANERVKALSQFLKVSASEIEESRYDSKVLEAEGGEYLVLDDGEADRAVREYISESLWAFRPEFLAPLVKEEIAEELEEFGESVEEHIKELQKRSEDSNADVRNLIDDFDFLVEEAVRADGRGHFLASYDNEEGETKVGGEWYFIYRVN